MLWLTPAGSREDPIEISDPLREALHVFLPETQFSSRVLGGDGYSGDMYRLRYEGGFRDPLSRFTVSNTTAAALVTVKPGGIRELHWHPNADEWQYWIKGQGRMTVFDTGPKAMTADFQAGDIGYVKKSLGHYVENTGDTDLVFLGLFKTDRYQEVTLADWLTHSPPQMVMQTLNISAETLAKLPRSHPGVMPR